MLRVSKSFDHSETENVADNILIELEAMDSVITERNERIEELEKEVEDLKSTIADLEGGE